MTSSNYRQETHNKQVSLQDLYLDPNNYRLIHEKDYQEISSNSVKEKRVQGRTFKMLAKDKNQNIQDLIDSFKINGYLPVDQIQVTRLEQGGFIVIEGNRRIAALKYLQSVYEEKEIDLGKLNPEIFNDVPIIFYPDSDDVHHLTLMALKHISGNRKWGEWNQAKLLEELFSTHRLSEEDICKRIGISKIELRRSLRALSLLKQYSSSDYGDQFDENMFPLFREAVRSASLKNMVRLG